MSPGGRSEHNYRTGTLDHPHADQRNHGLHSRQFRRIDQDHRHQSWRTLWIDPGFETPSDLFTLTITDDDPTFVGDTGSDEIGDGSTQTGRAHNSGNSSIGSGRIPIEDKVSITDAEGNLFDLCTVEIGGNLPSVLAVPKLVPGVTCEVISSTKIDGIKAPACSIFTAPTFDPGLGHTNRGGADDIHGSAATDTPIRGCAVNFLW
ncbi:hypothetical protein GCM10011415_34340 [Salipiger pallidus]|uniref:Uncharacterized protein n=1 Tax=Salipiger pallidus TaxID=1775170 RepID=A0A8J2ZMV4_9RHOB|nr:hypothetical protein [Salipiger pallidus]GGG81853.1 hypothetical protein GCM10011415_34340 [Salipiger pallidus]